MCSSGQAVCHHQLCLSAPWRCAARATRQNKRASRWDSCGTFNAGTGLKTTWHASARTCDRVVTRWQQAGRDSLIQKSSIRTQLASERISPERVNHHRRLSACRSVGRPDGLSLALPHTPGRAHVQRRGRGQLWLRVNGRRPRHAFALSLVCHARAGAVATHCRFRQRSPSARGGLPSLPGGENKNKKGG